MAAGEGRNAMDRGELRVVEAASDWPLVDDVAAAEVVALTRAIGDMDQWITSLPSASEWSWTFRRMRAQLACDLELRGRG